MVRPDGTAGERVRAANAAGERREGGPERVPGYSWVRVVPSRLGREALRDRRVETCDAPGEPGSRTDGRMGEW